MPKTNTKAGNWDHPMTLSIFSWRHPWFSNDAGEA